MIALQLEDMAFFSFQESKANLMWISGKIVWIKG